MKKSQNTKSVAASGACCSRRQKIYGVIALGGLFACGLMVGISLGARHTSADEATPVVQTHVDDIPTCARIEKLLLQRINNNAGSADDFMFNANTYASMVEYGCPENADVYRSKAIENIEIANALSDGAVGVYNPGETEYVIDTYKKLDMQNQAREFLNKVQKLTDPAIDFILKMEQIINE